MQPSFFLLLAIIIHLDPKDLEHVIIEMPLSTRGAGSDLSGWSWVSYRQTGGQEWPADHLF